MSMTTGTEAEMTPSAESAESTETTSTEAATKTSTTKKWYIVHTYSGQETRARTALLERAKTMGFEAEFDEVLVPEESVVEIVKGKKRTSKRKFFPGYIMVHMDLTDETWHVVKGTPKITGFVGNATDPPPITDEEVARMTQRIKEGATKPKPLIHFDDGENIRVVSGPFANFQGFVDEVMEDKEKLRVMVQVFGRATPVVLGYASVEKA